MVTTAVTTTFHNPSRERRREWQRATHLYRDTKQFCIDGWEADESIIFHVTNVTMAVTPI